MRCNVILLAAAIFLCSLGMAKSKGVSTSQASSQVGNQTSAGSGHDCSGDFEALGAARQVVDGDQRAPNAQSVVTVASETNDDSSGAIDLERDLKLLEQKQTDLSRCTLANDAQELPQNSSGPCFGELALNFEMRHDGEPEQDIPIGRLPGSRAFFMRPG